MYWVLFHITDYSAILKLLVFPGAIRNLCSFRPPDFGLSIENELAMYSGLSCTYDLCAVD
jgi:hypothetical protein